MTTLRRRVPELTAKYEGRYLALVGRRLVTVDTEMKRAYTTARRKHPDAKIVLFYAPRDEETATLL